MYIVKLGLVIFNDRAFNLELDQYSRFPRKEKGFFLSVVRLGIKNLLALGNIHDGCQNSLGLS